MKIDICVVIAAIIGCVAAEVITTAPFPGSTNSIVVDYKCVRLRKECIGLR